VAINPFTGGKHRTVVESKRYEREMLALGDIQRLDEALRGFVFTVSWDPEKGRNTVIPGIRGMVVGGYGVPSMVIYYTVTLGDDVELLSVRLADDSDG